LVGGDEDEDDGRKAAEKNLEAPEARMVYRRESVEAHLVATRLTGIASEDTLFITVDGVTDGGHDEHTEDEIDCPPSMRNWS